MSKQQRIIQITLFILCACAWAHRRLLLQAGLSFDTAIDGNVGLGNLFTQVSAALEMRFGHNMPSGLVIVGLHYERKNWGIHFSVMESSDNVDTNQAPAAENRERLGAIDIEWRF